MRTECNSQRGATFVSWGDYTAYLLYLLAILVLLVLVLVRHGVSGRAEAR